VSGHDNWEVLLDAMLHKNMNKKIGWRLKFWSEI